MKVTPIQTMWNNQLDSKNNVTIYFQMRNNAREQWCVQIIFFSLFLALLGFTYLILMETQGITNEQDNAKNRIQNFIDEILIDDNLETLEEMNEMNIITTEEVEQDLAIDAMIEGSYVGSDENNFINEEHTRVLREISRINEIDNKNDPLEEIGNEESESELNGAVSDEEVSAQEIVENSANVTIKFGVGMALIVAAYFVLIGRWNSDLKTKYSLEIEKKLIQEDVKYLQTKYEYDSDEIENNDKIGEYKTRNAENNEERETDFELSI